MSDSKIRFSVEGIQELKGAMGSVLKETALQAKLIEASNKEFTKNLQQQIELLKQRKSLLTETPSGAINSNVNLPSTPTSSSSQETSSVETAFQTTKKSTRELQQLLVSLNRKIVEQKRWVTETQDDVQKRKELMQKANYANKDQATAEYKASLKALKDDRKRLRDLKDEKDDVSLDLKEAARRDRFRDKDKGLTPSMVQSFAMSNLINPITSRDPINAATSTAQNVSASMMMAGGKMGWIGLGLGLGVAVAGAQTQLLREIMPSASRIAKQRGGKADDYINYGRNEYAELGFDRKTVLENQASIISSLGRNNLVALKSSLGIQAGFDVSQQDLSGVMRAGRGDSNFDLGRTFTKLYNGLRVGLGKEKTEAFIPEYLRILTEQGQKQLESLGKVDFGINTRFMTFLSGGSDRLKNPDTLRSVMGQVYGGLTNASTPQVEALQYQTLSKLFPGKSLWELQKKREAPLESGNESYLPEFIKNLRTVSSSQEEFERNISNVFGIGKNIASDLGKDWGKEGWETRFKKEIGGGITEQDIYKRGVDAVDKFAAATAKWENVLVGDFTKTVSEGISKMVTSLEILAAGKQTPVIPGSPFQDALFKASLPFISKLLP